MARTETFSCFIVSCDHTDVAHQAYQAAKDHFYETGRIGEFDAAVGFGASQSDIPGGEMVLRPRDVAMSQGLIATSGRNSAAPAGCRRP